jgi:hypothetical protein
MGDHKQIRSGWLEKRRGGRGKSEVNQVPAKMEEKVAEGRAAQSRATLHLSGGAFVCALLSSQRPSAIVQSVASPRALRVSIMPALMLSDGSRA